LGAERLRRGLLLAAVLLVAATGWRAERLRLAAPGDATLKSVDLERLGALRIEAQGALWRVRWSGQETRVVEGQRVRRHGTEAWVEERPAGAWRELVRTPWSVYGGPAGFRRIDFGPDPTGREDGVRDRIVLPRAGSAGGWFRLVPDGERFSADARGGLLVAERPGLTLDGAPLPVGVPQPVDGAFEVDGAGLRVAVAWTDGVTARPIRRGGRITAWSEWTESLWTVRVWEPDGTERAPWLVLRQGADAVEVALGPGATVVHGRGDRIGVGGSVLPEDAADEALAAAAERGFAEGWIELGPDRAFVAAPTDVSRRMRRRLRGLLETYDRARVPLAIRLPGGGGEGLQAVTARGLTPARYDRELHAWTASDRGPATVEFELPASTDRLVAALPVDYQDPTGRWRALLAAPLGWTEADLPSSTTRVRVRRRPAGMGETLAASVAGGPDGTFLRSGGVRFGRRAFDGWADATSASAATAAEAWSKVPGDRWQAEGAGPTPPARARSAYVRIPVDARFAGALALDITLPADAVGATWNGRPIAPMAAGSRRLSLPLTAGANLLALELALPASRAVASAGGVRFRVDGAGNPTGIDPSVARMTRRPAVIADTAPAIEAVPRVVVERGGGLLPDGARWRVDRTSRLIVPAADGVLVRRDEGRLELRDGDPTWVNGARSLGVVRRVDTDPDGPPLAGYRVAPGRLQPLVAPGDGLLLADPIRRAVPHPDEFHGDVVVGGPEPLQLQLTGPLEAPAFDLRLRRDGATLSFATDRPARVLHADGAFESVPESAATDWIPWPPGSRLLIADPPMVLLRPTQDPARPAWLPAAIADGSTVDPLAQSAVEAALADAISRSNIESDDPASLRGAMVILDADSGAILACAGDYRTAPEPGWLPCAQDVTHAPGSTFKIAVATAALRSTDPTVQSMLRGRPPRALGGDPRSSLQGARLPALPIDRTPRKLRSKLSNHRGGLMAPDTDLALATQRSLNTWFGYLGLLLHRPYRQGWGDSAIAGPVARAAAWPVLDVAQRAGFGSEFDLAGLRATGGHTPGASAPSDAVIAARSVGQGEVRATPLGIALLVAGAVTGSIPAPRLDADATAERRELLDATSVRRLTAALSAVVQRGTAKRAFADNPDRHRIVGKTGSAERIDSTGLSRTDAWFAGALLPERAADGPPLVLVVVLPDGGLGGRAAAEAADQALQSLVRAREGDRTVTLR